MPPPQAKACSHRRPARRTRHTAAAGPGTGRAKGPTAAETYPPSTPSSLVGRMTASATAAAALLLLLACAVYQPVGACRPTLGLDRSSGECTHATPCCTHVTPRCTDYIRPPHAHTCTNTRTHARTHLLLSISLPPHLSSAHTHLRYTSLPLRPWARPCTYTSPPPPAPATHFLAPLPRTTSACFLAPRPRGAGVPASLASPFPPPTHTLT